MKISYSKRYRSDEFRVEKKKKMQHESGVVSIRSQRSQEEAKMGRVYCENNNYQEVNNQQ
jgi:hypothetical protein